MDDAPKNGVLFAALGVFVLVIVFVNAVMSGPDAPASPRSPLPAPPPRVSPRPASRGPRPPPPVLRKDWPMFRGGPSLVGVAGTAIGHKLRLKWRFTTGGRVLSSAAISGGRVYVGSDDGILYCLDAANGIPVWRYQTGKKNEDTGEMYSSPVRSSPCVWRDRVFVGSVDGRVHAVRRKDGKPLWVFETDGEVQASPVLIDGKLLIGSYDSNLYCLNPDSGEVIWKVETEDRVHATSGSDGVYTIVTGCDGMLRSLGIDNGKERAAFNSEYPIPPSAALYRGTAYVGNYGGRFFAVDCATGKKLWQYPKGEVNEDDRFLASPAVTAERVVFGGQDGRVHCLERRTGRRLWTFKTGDYVDSPPSISGELVFVGSDDGTIYGLSLADGTKKWSYAIGQPIQASPAIGEGLLVIGANDKVVYAFAPR